MSWRNRLRALSCGTALVALASAVGSASAWGETASPDKRAEIKVIMAKTKSTENVKRGIDAFAPMVVRTLRAKHPEMTSEQTQAVLDIIREVSTEQLRYLENAAVDAYDETYSSEEIDALYNFYSSPIGSMVASKTGLLQQNILLKGQAIGQTFFAPELNKRLKANELLKGIAD